jgi:hypothetical protein
MKRIVLIFLLIALTACAGLRRRVFYEPDPGCARRTIEKHFGGNYPRAQWIRIGNTDCVMSDPSLRNKAIIYCPDPPYVECR